MADEFQQLLTATIDHLENLKAHGERNVVIKAETLAALAAPAPMAPRVAVVPVSKPVPTAVKPAAPVAPVVAVVNVPATPTNPAALAAVPVSIALSQSGEVLTGHARAQAMADLRERALVCVKCPNLVASRNTVVFGVGNIEAELMFVGEAPGADEDEQGEPFVGAAGQLLTRIIQTMGLSREKVYIANILKCRPDMPQGSSGNRKPTPEEMKTCLPYLQAQIDLIRPRVMVALGGTAVEGLLGLTGITKLRGNWQEFRGIPVMPTYHPSYLLRNQALSEKRRVWEDMLAVMERLGMPISEKQRGYFLKG